MKTAEELKENVRKTYAQVARQSKETNASSCCGAFIQAGVFQVLKFVEMFAGNRLGDRGFIKKSLR